MFLFVFLLCCTFTPYTMHCLLPTQCIAYSLHNALIAPHTMHCLLPTQCIACSLHNALLAPHTMHCLLPTQCIACSPHNALLVPHTMHCLLPTQCIACSPHNALLLLLVFIYYCVIEAIKRSVLCMYSNWSVPTSSSEPWSKHADAVDSAHLSPCSLFAYGGRYFQHQLATPSTYVRQLKADCCLRSGYVLHITCMQISS